MNEIKLNSVNWEHGMLLTPDHFVRQEKYSEALSLWAARYLTADSGLIGGGPRVPESERGAVRHDPVLSLEENGDNLLLTISQARGITASGFLIDVDPAFPVHASIPRAELARVAEAGVYLVADPDSKIAVDGTADEFNPQMKTERRPAYRISVQPHAEDLSYGLAVARLRRQSLGPGFEIDPSYIPPCTSLASFSELAAGWRKVVQQVTTLSQRYRELHRAMRDFIRLFVERGIETEEDRDAASFVERMVLELQALVFETIDPVQIPQKFFGALRKSIHAAAVFFDLSPAVQRYYETLKETGETEFVALVEQQRRMLEMNRLPNLTSNLANELITVSDALHSLGRLESALEGKYVDFHLSPALDGMNFVFDRGGQVLYKIAAKPGRFQGAGEDITVHFSQLRLEGRDKYRLILIGERNAPFERGYKIAVEIRINEGSGFRREPISMVYEVKDASHRNFEFDFDAPDVPTITDLRVTLQAHHPVRTALLFTRHRFYSASSGSASAPVRPIERPSGISGQLDESALEHAARLQGVSPRDPGSVPRTTPSPVRPSSMPPDYSRDPRLAALQQEQPPWGKRGEPEPNQPAPPPTRRRRLE